MSAEFCLSRTLWGFESQFCNKQSGYIYATFFFSSLPLKMFKNKKKERVFDIKQLPVYVKIKFLLSILVLVRLLKCVKYIYPSIAFKSSDQQLFIQVTN